MSRTVRRARWCQRRWERGRRRTGRRGGGASVEVKGGAVRGQCGDEVDSAFLLRG